VGGTVPGVSQFRRIAPFGPVDLAATVGGLRTGRHDPTTVVDSHELWRATRTADGPATLHVRAAGDGFIAEAWGPGAERMLDGAPDLLGASDDSGVFVAHHRAVAVGMRRRPGLRVGRSGSVLHALVPAVLTQRVTGGEAIRSWIGLCRALAEAAPGPRPLVLPPDPARLADQPYWWFHRFGVERSRAETIRRVARLGRHLEAMCELSWADARRRLLAVAGIGPWTAAVVADVALGDPDAVPIGDYHLPHVVAHALAGEPRATDARMLELLAPYGDQRGRAVRYLIAAGARAPKFGPRRAVMPIARW
jgi:3-methyladenine DNA glycosylase/8-oxoguanine DNA glycosylase